jgi:hypothetical protein
VNFKIDFNVLLNTSGSSYVSIFLCVKEHANEQLQTLEAYCEGGRRIWPGPCPLDRTRTNVLGCSYLSLEWGLALLER